eukprot:Rhum_TRINITY_DN9200_c0_g1::Rhum_TRINITY_DN9200_c0_g1_i1::g.32207::m.32207
MLVQRLVEHRHRLRLRELPLAPQQPHERPLLQHTHTAARRRRQAVEQLLQRRLCTADDDGAVAAASVGAAASGRHGWRCNQEPLPLHGHRVEAAVHTLVPAHNARLRVERRVGSAAAADAAAAGGDQRGGAHADARGTQRILVAVDARDGHEHAARTLADDGRAALTRSHVLRRVHDDGDDRGGGGGGGVVLRARRKRHKLAVVVLGVVVVVVVLRGARSRRQLRRRSGSCRRRCGWKLLGRGGARGEEAFEHNNTLREAGAAAAAQRLRAFGLEGVRRPRCCRRRCCCCCRHGRRRRRSN